MRNSGGWLGYVIEVYQGEINIIEKSIEEGNMNF